MEKIITENEVRSLLEKIQAAMVPANMPGCVITATRLEIVHPVNWEVSLFVKSMGFKDSYIRKKVEEVLFSACGVEEQCCDYLGKQGHKGVMEWYFRHPDVPQETYDRLEAEIEMELGQEIGMGLPCPNGVKSTSENVFMTIKDEFFQAIARGEKTIEYRNLNQYYCDKLFPKGVQKKYIRFNRGYQAGAANQMVYEIEEILLVSDKGVMIPATVNGKPITSYTQLPPRFAPAMYGIKLGRRVS